jgi:hypothetical protein
VLSLSLFHRLLPNLFRRKLSQLSHIRTTGGIFLEYGSIRESSSRFGKGGGQHDAARMAEFYWSNGDVIGMGLRRELPAAQVSEWDWVEAK